MPRVYYLERSPLTGELQSAEDGSQDDAFYRPGELYLLVPSGMQLAERYALRVLVGDDILDDSLERVANQRYRLRFVASELAAREPTFGAVPPVTTVAPPLGCWWRTIPST